MRRRWYPDEQRVTTVVRGPDPLAVALIGALDVAHGRAMAGLTGRTAGDPSDPSYRFEGHGPMLQDFRGGSLVTSGGRPAAGDGQALPGTTTPPGATSEILELLRRTRTGRR